MWCSTKNIWFVSIFPTHRTRALCTISPLKFSGSINKPQEFDMKSINIVKVSSRVIHTGFCFVSDYFTQFRLFSYQRFGTVKTNFKWILKIGICNIHQGNSPLLPCKIGYVLCNMQNLINHGKILYQTAYCHRYILCINAYWWAMPYQLMQTLFCYAAKISIKADKIENFSNFIGIIVTKLLTSVYAMKSS